MRWVALLACAALSACANDFESFAFAAETADAAPGGRDGGAAAARYAPEMHARVEGLGADAATGAQSGMGASPPAAGSGPEASRLDAGSDDARVADSSRPSMDASNPAVDDDASVQADPAADLLCEAEFAEAVPEAIEDCMACGCGSCSEQAVACLADDPLCRAVVRCAIQQGCRFGDCYCRNSQCGRFLVSGNGPCVAEFEAAAGGAKDAVMRKWASDDEAEPLVRARELIGCLVGLDGLHPRGPTTGACSDRCN